jgi:hypothetical protein
MQQVKQRVVGLDMIATELGQAFVWGYSNVDGHGKWLDSFDASAIRA